MMRRIYGIAAMVSLLACIFAAIAVVVIVTGHRVDQSFYFPLRAVELRSTDGTVPYHPTSYSIVVTGRRSDGASSVDLFRIDCQPIFAHDVGHPEGLPTAIAINPSITRLGHLSLLMLSLIAAAASILPIYWMHERRRSRKGRGFPLVPASPM